MLRKLCRLPSRCLVDKLLSVIDVRQKTLDNLLLKCKAGGGLNDSVRHQLTRNSCTERAFMCYVDGLGDFGGVSGCSSI